MGEQTKPQALGAMRQQSLFQLLLGIFVGGVLGFVGGWIVFASPILPFEATPAWIQTTQTQAFPVCATITPPPTSTPLPSPTLTLTLSPTLTPTPTLTPIPRPEDSLFWVSEMPYAEQLDGMGIVGGYLLDDAEAQLVPEDSLWLVSSGGWKGYRYLSLKTGQPISVLWALDQPIAQDGLYEVLVLDTARHSGTPNTDLKYTLLVDDVAQMPWRGSSVFQQHMQAQQLRLVQGVSEVMDEWRLAGVYQLYSGQRDRKSVV